MNAEPANTRFKMEDQPRRPGYRQRSVATCIKHPMKHLTERGASQDLLIIFGLLLATGLGFFLLWPVAWAYLGRDTTQRGILEDPADWPVPIQKLSDAIVASNLSSPPLEVFLLRGQRASNYSVVVCRAGYSNETWETIKSKLELQPVEPAFRARLHDDIVSKSDASWWPGKEDNAEYFASARLLSGDECDLYQCSVDRDSGMIFIHYHFNW